MMYYARAIRFYRSISGDELIQVLMSDGVIENYKNDAHGRKAAFEHTTFNTAYFDEREDYIGIRFVISIAIFPKNKLKEKESFPSLFYFIFIYLSIFNDQKHLVNMFK